MNTWAAPVPITPVPITSIPVMPIPIMPIPIMTVCSHNRTRSVMTMAMLQHQLDERLGANRITVTSGGFGPAGHPPIPAAAAAMNRRGFDVTAHRSTPIDASALDRLALILTAERDHVVRIAALDAAAGARAMTLPEFVERGASNPPRPGVSLREWTTELTADRDPHAYLAASIGEIADPTGQMPRRFEQAVAAMEALCQRAASLIASVTPCE